MWVPPLQAACSLQPREVMSACTVFDGRSVFFTSASRPAEAACVSLWLSVNPEVKGIFMPRWSCEAWWCGEISSLFGTSTSIFSSISQFGPKPVYMSWYYMCYGPRKEEKSHQNRRRECMPSSQVYFSKPSCVGKSSATGSGIVPSALIRWANVFYFMCVYILSISCYCYFVVWCWGWGKLVSVRTCCE